jgi:hypothetical protein
VQFACSALPSKKKGYVFRPSAFMPASIFFEMAVTSSYDHPISGGAFTPPYFANRSLR